MTTTPQTLTLAGEDYVVIPRDEYERLRAAADEDAADVAATQRVLDDPDETWAPAELVRRIVEGEHPVRVWRTHRGMTARALAVAADIPSSYLSAIERGVKPGSVKALKSLATALDVPLDDPGHDAAGSARGVVLRLRQVGRAPRAGVERSPINPSRPGSESRVDVDVIRASGQDAWLPHRTRDVRTSELQQSTYKRIRMRHLRHPPGSVQHTAYRYVAITGSRGDTLRFPEKRTART